MPQILETLKSEEGVSVVEGEGPLKGSDMFSAFDEIDLTQEEEDLEDEESEDEKELEGEADEMGELHKCMIDNEYVAEKLSAIYCVEEIARYLFVFVCLFES